MANYNVDIEVAVKNLNAIKSLKRELSALEKSYDDIKKASKSGASHELGSRKQKRQRDEERQNLLDQKRLTGELKRAEAGRRADLIRSYRMQRQEELSLKRIAEQRMKGLGQYAVTIGPQPDRIGEIRKKQQQVRLEAASKINFQTNFELVLAQQLLGTGKKQLNIKQQITDQQQTQIKNAQALNAQRDRALAKDKKELDNLDRKTKLARNKRINAAVTGGAFPLLFGGGAGQALGGFIGGGISGQMFSGMTVGLQVLGSALDSTVVSVSNLGSALNPVSGNFEAVAEAAGYANTEILDHIKTIETLGDKNRALEIATEQLTRTVGADGVDALRRFGDASKDLANSTAQAMSQAFATIAAALEPLTRAAANFAKFAVAVGQAQTSEDPRLKAVRGEIKDRMKTYDNQFGGINNLENRQKIRELRREELYLIERINVEQQISIESEAKKLKLKKDVEALNVKTPKQLELARKLLEAGNDLTNKRVVGLMEQLIQENFIVTTQKELKKMVDANIDSQTIILKLKEIELDRDEEIVELRNRINNALGKGVKNNEKTAEQKTRELEQAQELAKEFQREIRLRELGSDTARELLEIQFEHENVVKQINDLENQSLAVEQKISAEKLKQLKINETLAKFATTKTEGEQNRDDINRENNLLAAKLQGREKEFLLNERIKELGEDFINDLEVQQALQDRITAEDFASSQEAEIERLEAKINGTEEQFNLEQKIQAIRDLGLSAGETELLINEQKIVDLIEQVRLIEKQDALYEQVGQTIKAGIVNGIMSAIDGSKSLSESLSGLLRQVGGIFLQAGVSSLGQSLKIPGFAEGGYVTGTTPAVIGEGGEPEYVIPESKMRESMSRYSRGARGSSVIPEVGGSGASSGGGGLAVAAPIDVRYTVERINSVDYVTADQFQNGMQQAATQGAKQGEQATLKRLQMSGSTRKRIGI